jgi:hypothetical protein
MLREREQPLVVARRSIIQDPTEKNKNESVIP